jgi:hypothetical protein
LKKNWALASKDHIPDDDDDVIQGGGHSFNQVNEEPEEEEETLKPGNSFKAARQTMMERKMNQADARGQLSK